MKKRKLGDVFSELPPLSIGGEEGLALLTDLNVSASKLERVFEKDPIITARILKVANSAFYNVGKEITSVREAIVFIGNGAVRAIVLAFLLKSLTNGVDFSPYPFSASEFLKHSVLVGILSREIHRKAYVGDEPDTAFTAGLLHDVGQVAIAKFLEGSGVKFDGNEREILVEELKIVGEDHQGVGEAFLEKMRVPKRITAVVGSHHSIQGKGSVGKSVYWAELWASGEIDEEALAGELEYPAEELEEIRGVAEEESEMFV